MLKRETRRLTDEMSEENQIKNLYSLINNPPQNSRVVTFSPHLAKHILDELNTSNRSMKLTKVDGYKKDMLEDNWSLTGETIKFGTDGLLKDGQNRLKACVDAGVSFTTHAIFGIDPQTFHHMDTGKNRDGKDVLAIMGVKNSTAVANTVKLIMCYSRGRPSSRNYTITNGALKDFYINAIDHELIQEAVKRGEKVSRQTRYPKNPLSALYYIASMSGEKDKYNKFLDDMSAGIGSQKHPPRLLLETVTKLRVDREHISSGAFSIMLALSWKNFREGKKSTKTQLIESSKGYRMQAI